MKRVVFIITVFAMIMILGSAIVFADEVTNDPNEPLILSFELGTSEDCIGYELREDIIRWRYKTINGSLYRRKYNYTKKIWIGNWEKV